jgi:hypothetical protein
MGAIEGGSLSLVLTVAPIVPPETSCFYLEDGTMDIVHNCDSYINIPSPQIYRSL